MSQQANVQAIYVLDQFRVALRVFAEKVAQSMEGVDYEGRSFQDWLQHDQQTHWKREHRRREEIVTVAKTELTRCLSSKVLDRTPSCVDQRVALKKAQAYLGEAEEKLHNIRRWDGELRQALTDYKAQTQALARAIEVDVPRAMALLDRLATTLDEYVNITSTGGGRPFASSATVERSEPQSPDDAASTSDPSANMVSGAEDNAAGRVADKDASSEAG